MAARKQPPQPPEEPHGGQQPDPEERGDVIRRFVREELAKGAADIIKAEVGDMEERLGLALSAGFEQINNRLDERLNQVPTLEQAAQHAKQLLIQEAEQRRAQAAQQQPAQQAPANGPHPQSQTIVQVGTNGQSAPATVLTDEQLAALPPFMRALMPMLNSASPKVIEGLVTILTRKFLGTPGMEMALENFDVSKVTALHIRKIATDERTKDLFAIVADETMANPILETIPKLVSEAWESSARARDRAWAATLRARNINLADFAEMVDAPVETPDFSSPADQVQLLTRMVRVSKRSASSTASSGSKSSAPTSSARPHTVRVLSSLAQRGS